MLHDFKTIVRGGKFIFENQNRQIFVFNVNKENSEIKHTISSTRSVFKNVLNNKLTGLVVIRQFTYRIFMIRNLWFLSWDRIKSIEITMILQYSVIELFKRHRYRDRRHNNNKSTM